MRANLRIVLLVGLMLLFGGRSVIAQDGGGEAPAVEEVTIVDQVIPHANLAEECERVITLMDLPNKPEDMIQGGGIINPNQTVTGLIIPEDAGDRWVFAAPKTERDPVVLNFENNDIPLLVQFFSGLDRIDRARIDPGGEVIEFDAPQTGYYSLTVSREDFADQDVIGSYALTVSGDVAYHLVPGEPVDIQLSEPVRRAFFLFHNRLGNGETSTQIRFTVESEQAARLRLLRNGELIEAASEPITIGRSTYTIDIDDNGYYVLAVAINDPNQPHGATVTLATTQDDLIPSANVDGLRQPRWEPNDNPPRVGFQENAGYVQANLLGATVQFPPDTATILVPSSSTRLEFTPAVGVESTGPNPLFSFFNENVERVALLDGNLGVTIQGGFYYFIEEYPWQQQFQDQTAFRTITLPDGRSFSNTNRTVVESVWMVEGCMGMQMTNGRRLITQGVDIDFGLDFGDGGPDTPLVAQPVLAIDEDGTTYDLTLNWNGIETIIASGGNVSFDLTDNRQLQFDRQGLIVQQDGGEFRVIEKITTDRGVEQENLLITDWENLLRVLVTGRTTQIDVLDERGRIERRRNVARTIESIDGVMRLLWQEGGQNLLLPESLDFIEIETPAEPIAYDPEAIPGTPGYLPAGWNRTGQECYTPVNTAFNFNCTENGFGNPANGNLSLGVTDVYAPGYRLDLGISRVYNSGSFRVDGPFGPGWSSDWLLDYNVLFDIEFRSRPVSRSTRYQIGLNLVNAPNGRIIYTAASGTQHVFNFVGNPGEEQWRSNTLPGWTILPRANELSSPWVVVSSDGTQYTYDVAGRFRGMAHPHGGSITVERVNEFPNPVYVLTDDRGRALRLEYNGDYHIVRSSLTDAEGNILGESLYGYDDNGYLTSVITDDPAFVEYQYNDQGQLTFHRDPRMPLGTEIYYDYDPQNRLRFITADPNQNRDTLYRLYRYNRDDELGTATTTVTDEWGRESQWEFAFTPDPATAYTLLRSFDGAGREEVYEYSDSLNPTLVSRIAREGVNYVLTYHEGTMLSSLGHPEAWIDFRSSFQTVNVGGNTVPRLSRYVEDNATGLGTTIYQYDEAGHVFEIRNNDNDEIMTMVRIDARDPDFGLPTRATIYYPPIDITQEGIVSSEAQTVTLSYDAYGYPATRTDDSGTHSFTHDAQGRLLAYSLANGDDILLDYSIAYERSTDGQCVTVTDILGAVRRACFDARQQLILNEVLHGEAVLQRINYAYDPFGRVVSIREAVDDDPANDITTIYEYAPAVFSEDGVWARRVTTANGVQVLTEFDAQDRVVLVRNRRGLETRYSYTRDDNNITVTRVAPDGTETIYNYNLAGQFCGVDYGEMAWQVFYGAQSCNSPQRSISRVSIDQRLTVDYADYTLEGQPGQINIAARIPGERDPAQFTLLTGARDNPILQTEYDARGRVSRLWNVASGEQTRYEYEREDGILNVTERRDNFTAIQGTSQSTLVEFDVTTYGFDLLERPVYVENSAGRIDYAYEYLPGRGLTRVTMSFSGGERPIVYATNTLGDLVEWQGADGVLLEYGYDYARRLLSVTADGAPQATYTYDRAGNVLSVTDEDGRTSRYRYNERDQLIETVDETGISTRYSYDTEGRLSAVTNALGQSTSYRYDTYGKLISVTASDGQQTDFSYNVLNGRVTVSDGVATTGYFFDLLGRLWQMQDANGTPFYLSYNASGRLNRYGPFERAYEFAFGYGAADQLISMSDGNAYNWAFGYNGRDQLISRTDPDGGVVELGYDTFGRLNRFDAGATMQFNVNYNADNRTVALIGGEGRVLVTYDEHGRAVIKDSSVEANEQIAQIEYTPAGYILTEPDGYTVTVAQSFDEQRRRVLTIDRAGNEQPAESSVTRITFDAAGRPLTIETRQCATAACESTFTRTESIRYDAAGRPSQVTDAVGNTTTYTYDRIGRLVAVQNADGATYRYAYDALNNLTRITNSSGQTLDLTYNPFNHLTSISRNGQLLDTYIYNAFGWLQERQLPTFNEGIGRYVYNYSSAGRPTVWIIDSNPALTLSREQDGAGRVVTADDVFGQLTNLRYSASGAVTEATAGSYSETFNYDALANLTGATWTVGGDSAAWTFRTGYDPDRVAYAFEATSDDGTAYTLLLDRALMPVAVNANGTTYDVQFTAESEHLRMDTGWEGRFTLGQTLDMAGNLLALSGADVQEIVPPLEMQFAYNAEGQPTSIITPDERRVVSYDRAGRPLTVRAFGPDGDDRGGQLVTYDRNGLRTEELRETADGGRESYDYAYREEDRTLLISRVQTRRFVPGLAANSAGLLALALGLLVLMRRRRVMVRAAAILLALGTVGLTVAIAQDATPSPDVPAEPAGPPTTRYTYNSRGHVATLSDGPVNVSMAYDSFDRLTEIAPAEGTPEQFQYDAFGRLVGWQGVGGFVQYRYEGERLLQIIRDGEVIVVDGLGSTPLGTSAAYNLGHDADIFGVQGELDPAAFALPIWNDMLYVQPYGVYVSLRGQGYDPRTGRTLQRDILGPDANGDLYAYGERAQPVILHRDKVPIMAGMGTLIDALTALDAPTAADVRAEHMPSLFETWEDPGLAAFAAYNASVTEALHTFQDVGAWLAYDYNPPGTVVRGEHFALLDNENPAYQSASGLDAPFIPGEHLLPMPDMNWVPTDASIPTYEPPSWYDPNVYRNLRTWQLDYTAPEPLDGFPLASELGGYFAYPFGNLADVAHLEAALANLPSVDVDAWAAGVEAAVLPSEPAPMPDTAQGWLAEWFTNDTIPVWETLRALDPLPAPPDAGERTWE